MTELEGKLAISALVRTAQFGSSMHTDKLIEAGWLFYSFSFSYVSFNQLYFDKKNKTKTGAVPILTEKLVFLQKKLENNLDDALNKDEDDKLSDSERCVGIATALSALAWSSAKARDAVLAVDGVIASLHQLALTEDNHGKAGESTDESYVDRQKRADNADDIRRAASSTLHVLVRVRDKLPDAANCILLVNAMVKLLLSRHISVSSRAVAAITKVYSHAEGEPQLIRTLFDKLETIVSNAFTFFEQNGGLHFVVPLISAALCFGQCHLETEERCHVVRSYLII